jgi:hypothetical protein
MVPTSEGRSRWKPVPSSAVKTVSECYGETHESSKLAASIRLTTDGEGSRSERISEDSGLRPHMVSLYEETHSTKQRPINNYKVTDKLDQGCRARGSLHRPP